MNFESESTDLNRTAKLPKLEIKHFDGDIINWPGFWDQFETAVHSKEDIIDIYKFNY